MLHSNMIETHDFGLFFAIYLTMFFCGLFMVNGQFFWFHCCLFVESVEQSIEWPIWDDMAFLYHQYNDVPSKYNLNRKVVMSEVKHWAVFVSRCSPNILVTGSSTNAVERMLLIWAVISKEITKDLKTQKRHGIRKYQILRLDVCVWFIFVRFLFW